MKTRIGLAVLLVFACLFPSFADVVLLKHGQVITGTVLQNNEQGVLIKLDYGTFTYPRSLVKDVQIDKVPASASTAETGKRIPAWGEIITKLAKCGWATPLRQIPATVINTGVLKNVPYLSFQCGYGYEVNIYGDLDNPAGVEIGLQSKLVNFQTAKTNCLEYLASVLPSQADRDVLKKLNPVKDLVTSNGLTFEVTPPTAEDAFGGWWVSVYSEDMLKDARASELELKEITQTTIAPPEPEPPRPQITSQPIAKPSSPGNLQVASSTDPGASIPPSSYSGWSASDFSYARSSMTYSRKRSSGGGSVYVSGYTRKDGTYVRSHSRRSTRH